MFSFSTQRRVLYGETDKMGYLYYGNYASYYETGRVESMRSIGLVYKELEDKGIIMPVLDMSVKYLKPAFYDDLLTIKTILPEFPDGFKLYFQYEIFNQHNQLLNTGDSTLIFFDAKIRKPIQAEEVLEGKLDAFFGRIK